MNTRGSHPFCFVIAFCVLTLLVLVPQHASSQTPDSSSNASGGALQFQLIGNVGAFYIANFGPSSFLRVGVNGSYNHSDNSGDAENYSHDAPSYNTTGTSRPDEKSTYYSISLSGVYALKIVGYANTALYCGAGPRVDYSYEWGSSKSFTQMTNSTLYGGNQVNEYSYSDSRTNKSWGIGPLAILEAKSQLISSVSLTAEVGLAALYQWGSQTSSSHSVSKYPGQEPSISDAGRNQSMKGWKVSLSGVVIGVVVGL